MGAGGGGEWELTGSWTKRLGSPTREQHDCRYFQDRLWQCCEGHSRARQNPGQGLQWQGFVTVPATEWQLGGGSGERVVFEAPPSVVSNFIWKEAL